MVILFSKYVFIKIKLIWKLYTWGYGDLIYKYKSKQNDYYNIGLSEDIYFRFFQSL